MGRLEKLKLENIRKANELLDKGHTSQYPSKEQVELKPSDNVKNSPTSFINKMNNLKEGKLNEDGHMDIPSAIRKCKVIIDGAQDIMEKLSEKSKEEDNLPTWWMDKLTLATDYINKADDYINNSGQINEGIINEEPEKDTYWMITKANRENLIKMGGTAEEIGKSATNNFQKYCK